MIDPRFHYIRLKGEHFGQEFELVEPYFFGLRVVE